MDVGGHIGKVDDKGVNTKARGGAVWIGRRLDADALQVDIEPGCPSDAGRTTVRPEDIWVL